MARERDKEAPINIAVPIVPMLDMSFQLLSFFIITFKPMPTEGQLSINLPAEATEKPPEMVDTPDPDKKDEYTVTVYSSSAGELALLGLKGPTASLENIKNLNELLSELRKIPKPGSDSTRVSITIQAANDLNYARLIEVMDLCKKASFDSVNLMPMKRGGG